MTNESFIGKEIEWLSALIVYRLKRYFNKEVQVADIKEYVPQTPEPGNGPYCDFIINNALGFEDRVYLAMLSAPVLKPQIMDCFNVRNTNTDQRFVEFGCVESSDRNHVRPSLETVLFILAGNDITAKVPLIRYFSSHPVFNSSLFIKEKASNEVNYPLVPSAEFIDRILLGRKFSPDFSSDFPARQITTERSWEDLVLDADTMSQINEIKLWLQYGDTLMQEWGMKGKIKNGYRALFYGPSGTGKTFTASLLGKNTGKDVYCVDLSAIVSKYIGETEKNLSRIFAQAEDKDWILFFDEADALFGKRTGVKDSHDRYANQETAYLLQRVEDYRGLVVLSTNLKSNLDEAFARRFQSVIRFSMPGPEHREMLWRKSFSSSSVLDADIDLKEIAARYEISGGAILNVVQYCSLQSLSKGTNIIYKEDLLEGIRKEFRKEGRIVA